MTYPRYTPSKVTCRHCGATWSGNENGLRRHEALCDASGPISPEAKTDALVALELARSRGLFDEEQIERLGPLVAWLREDA